MCQWFLQINVQVVPQHTIYRLNTEEISITNELEEHKCKMFDNAIY